MPNLPTGPTGPASAIYRKISWHLLPLLFLLYVVAYLDRINIGFARLQMNADLGFSDTVYGFGAGIFFLGYFLFEVPSNLILHRVGARLWITRILIVWGVLSAATAWVESASGFYTLRFLLGVGEAGFFPGIIYYLTNWYPAGLRARSTAWFMAAIPAAGILGGPLSGWIMASLDGFQGLRGWQWLFIAEGLPAVALGAVTFFLLPDHPGRVPWLSCEEKALLRHQIEQGSGPETQPRTSSLRDAACSTLVWRLAAVYFLLVVGNYGISFWLPQIVHALHAGNYTATGLLSALPYGAAGAGMIAIGRHSDRTRHRSRHLIACCLLAASGFLASRTLDASLAGSLAALSIAAVGVISALALFWTLPTAFLSGRAAAGGIALINSVGNLGGYCSPTALGWLSDTTGRMDHGLLLLAAALILAALLSLARCTPPEPNRNQRIEADRAVSRQSG